MNRHRIRLLASASLSVGLLAAASAEAASLEQVDQSQWWGSVSDLPSYVNMYLYVPDQLAESPPIVVAPHHCQGTGPGTFSEMSSLVSLGDQQGFIMIFPEATGQNCWDAGSERSLTHDGNGDTHAIVQMVRYTLSTYGGNADRVYSVGGSSGGIMTEALLGVYPDVFMAGVSLMGVPCGCWAEGYNDVVGQPSDGTGQWSGPCAGGTVTKSAQEWGDLVRSYFPGYTGHRPRLQHWHGTADTVLNYANLAEDVKEWTNLLELSETPTGTDSPESGTTREFWTSSCGYTVYETFSMSGVGHGVPFDGNAVAAYFGLDDATGLDPETAACPGAVPGGGAGGTGGTGGAGGAGASGGIVETGGAGETTGGATGGSDVVDTGGSPPTGGTPSAGGVPATGGLVTTGGLPTGGAPATGGASPTTGGADATGGASLTGGAPGTGGLISGGTSVTGGAASGIGGDPATADPSAGDDAGDDGCQCALIGNEKRLDGGAATLLLTVLSLSLGRRRRRAR